MPFFEVFENCSYHLYNIGCFSMIYRLKYAKSESNFDSDFEHPTFQGDFVFCQHYPGRCPGLEAFGLSARPRLPLFRLMTHPHN